MIQCYLRCIFLVILPLFFLTGCPEFPRGHYEGIISHKTANGESSQIIGLDVVPVTTRHRLVVVKNEQGIPVTELEFSRISSKRFDLRIPLIRSEKFRLKKMPAFPAKIGSSSDLKAANLSERICYSEFSQWYVEACFDREQFSLRAREMNGVGQLSITGTRFAIEREFTLETPVKLSLNEAIDRSLNFSFDARVTSEKNYQARQRALAAQLQLAPHFSTGLIWLVEPTPASILIGILGMAPFLLPTYWLDAKTATIEEKLSHKAMMILRADLCSNVESLFYIFEKDVAIRDAYLEFLEVGNNLRSQIKSVFPDDGHSSAALTQINELIQELQNSVESSEVVIAKDRHALSFALGFRNPEAVKETLSDPTRVPDTFTPLDPERVARIGLKRSFELEQVDLLVRPERYKKIRTFFNWIDPSGDSRVPLGLNLIPQTREIEGKIRELKIKREEIQSSIFNNAYEIVLSYSTALKHYHQKKRKLESLKLQFENTKKVPGSPSELGSFVEVSISTLKEFVANKLDVQTEFANFKIARSKLDRILLAGHYNRLLSNSTVTVDALTLLK